MRGLPNFTNGKDSYIKRKRQKIASFFCFAVLRGNVNDSAGITDIGNRGILHIFVCLCFIDIIEYLFIRYGYLCKVLFGFHIVYAGYQMAFNSAQVTFSFAFAFST